MAEWVECKLADVCSSIDYGLTASASDSSDGPRFLRITDIVPGRIDWNSVPTADATPEAQTKYRLDDGDIVVARTGASTGTSAYIARPPDAVFASYLVRLKIKPEFDARYVAYYLKSEPFWAFIRGVLGDKSAQPNASASTMTRAPFRAPRSLSEQQRIAGILGALDDKIELNRRMSETIEATVRALFMSWFVDFDPVRAQSEGRDPGLPARLATLFPPAFATSDLGEIPEGWTIGTLGEVAENPRRGVQPSDISPQTPHIALEHMPRHRVGLYDWAHAEGLESNKFAFTRGDILFGKLRPYFHKVGIAPVDGICSTDILVITPTSDRWFGFVLGTVASSRFVEYTDAGSTGTRMPRTSWTQMSSYKCVLPPEQIAAALTAVLRPLVDRLIASIHEARALAELRDTLMPGLVSGDLNDDLTHDSLTASDA